MKFMIKILAVVTLFVVIGITAVQAQMPDPQDAVDSASTLATAIGVLAAGLLLWSVGRRLVAKYVKAIVLFGTFAAFGSTAFAAMPDPTATVTAASTLATAIGVLAAGLLLWTVGRRLVAKYVK